MSRIRQIPKKPAGLLPGQTLCRPVQQGHQGRDRPVEILAEYAQLAAAYSPDIRFGIFVQDQRQNKRRLFPESFSSGFTGQVFLISSPDSPRCRAVFQNQLMAAGTTGSRTHRINDGQ